jgi:hypothetical protein
MHWLLFFEKHFNTAQAILYPSCLDLNAYLCFYGGNLNGKYNLYAMDNFGFKLKNSILVCEY